MSQAHGHHDADAAWPEDFAELPENEQLSAFLTKSRADATVPESVWSVRTRMRAGVTQEQMALALSVSVATYGRLEAGTAPWTSARVYQAADFLGMSVPQRRVFYSMVLGTDRLDLLGVPGVGRHARMLVDDMILPGVIIDPVTEILHFNDAFARRFPTLSKGTSFARWVLTDSSVRTYLLAWRSCWAVPVIDCLITAKIEAHPDWMDKIAHVIDSLRAASAEIDEIWSSRELASPGVGDEAPEPVLPGQERLMRLESLAFPGYRTFVVVPDGAYLREGTTAYYAQNSASG
jgi:transcriptional regulator with XRE-family HTH domain